MRKSRPNWDWKEVLLGKQLDDDCWLSNFMLKAALAKTRIVKPSACAAFFNKKAAGTLRACR
jgi:hypothetical protein